MAISSTKHRASGMTRTVAKWTADGSGVVSATSIPVGYGKLAAVALPMRQLGRGSVGNVIVTVTGPDGGNILVYDTDALKFGSTTTGDATGGAAEDLFTAGASHGLAAGDTIRFFALTGGTGLAVDTDYFVSNDGSLAATTFRLCATAADAAAGTPVVNFTTDVTASSWVRVASLAAGGLLTTSPYFRPTTIITDIDGTAVTADATAPNVNRDVYVFGSVLLSVAQGGVAGEGVIELIVDENALGQDNIG